MRIRPLVIASASVLLLAALTGCATQSSTSIDETPTVPVESRTDLVHPPYVDGVGNVTGTLVRSTVATYPAGSLQEPLSFPTIIVRWDDNGVRGESEFLINGNVDLIIDSEVERLATAERVSAALESVGPGIALDIGYSGTDLAPTWYSTPPDDFPYAVVTTLTIGPSE